MYVSYDSRNKQCLLSSKSPLTDVYVGLERGFERQIQRRCLFAHFHGNILVFCNITITRHHILITLLYMLISTAEKNNANYVNALRISYTTPFKPEKVKPNT